MVGPPFDPVVHLPYEDAYKISGRDMHILQNALRHKSKNEMLEKEIISLRGIIDEYFEAYGELK